MAYRVIGLRPMGGHRSLPYAGRGGRGGGRDTRPCLPNAFLLIGSCGPASLTNQTANLRGIKSRADPVQENVDDLLGLLLAELDLGGRVLGELAATADHGEEEHDREVGI